MSRGRGTSRTRSPAICIRRRKLSMHGYTLRRPCFVGNGRRLVLPAFGTYAGGLNVLDRPFEPLFGNDGMHVWMLGQEGLYPVATRLLKED